MVRPLYMESPRDLAILEASPLNSRVVQYTRTESGRQTSTTTRLTGSQVVVLEAEVT